MALIMQEAIKNETFLRVESDLSYTIPVGAVSEEEEELSEEEAFLEETSAVPIGWPS